jgi:endonuclease YncB( thermonuclease family)
MEPGLILPVNYMRAVDGDTIEFEIRRTFKLRLRDIDVYEKDTPEGKEAKDFVGSILEFADDILVFIPTNDPVKLMDINSFERIVGDVYIKDKNLSDILRTKGFEKR